MNQKQCSIYEFSRQFLEPKWSSRLNQYVTTGFNKEIGGESRKVPKNIADIVYNNSLRINDNYPPPPNEISLIARELERYAILAVATRLVDDIDRPLVAYRYFWLEKPSNDLNIDGIGTLLQWWEKNKHPHFELKSTIKLDNTSSRLLDKENLIKQYQDDQSLKDLLSKISHSSDNSPIYLLHKHEFFGDFEKFHAFVLLLNQRYHSPITWAWKVDKLYAPRQFALTLSTNNSQLTWVRKVDKLDKLDDPQQFVLKISTSNSQLKPTINDIKKKYTLPMIAENSYTENSTDTQLKRCLIEIARDRNLNQNFEKLAIYLEKSDSYVWQWEILEDEKILTEKKNTIARYKALLAILKPCPEIYKWLAWLKKQRNRKFWQIGIKLQDKFINFLDSHEALSQCKSKIDTKIDKLIIELLHLENYSKNLTKKGKKPPLYLPKEREKLLVQSRSFWVRYFKDYARQYHFYLTFQLRFAYTGNNKFEQKVLSDLEEWQRSEQYFPENKQDYYEFIARLFAQIEYYSLSAVFYQISLDSVPYDIYKKVETEFILLKKDAYASGLMNLSLSNLKQEIRLLFANLVSKILPQ